MKTADKSKSEPKAGKAQPKAAPVTKAPAAAKAPATAKAPAVAKAPQVAKAPKPAPQVEEAQPQGGNWNSLITAALEKKKPAEGWPGQKNKRGYGK